MGKAKQTTGTDQNAADSTAVLSFESALSELESTVGRLEEGEMPLEEALLLFETGVKLSQQCATTLDAAEKRIEILIADQDSAVTEGVRIESFETEDSDEEDFEDE